MAPAAVIERYFEVSLYLLLVSGFVTLVSTGKLDLPTVGVVGGAFTYRGLLLRRGEVRNLQERWVTLATWFLFLFYVADFFVISLSFVTATMHLMLFGMVLKLFSVHRRRDHVYLVVLAFLEVLGAAILTVDTIFLVCFSVFLLLSVSTFISFEMKRSAAAAGAEARLHAPPRRIAPPLSATSAVLMAAILAGAVLIFFILPRVSAGYFREFAPRNEFVSGFSDDVRLGDIGQIKRSNTVVMHIQLEGEEPTLFDLKWRGLALAAFDGQRWSNQLPRLQVQRLHSNGIGLGPAFRTDPRAPYTGRYRPLRYRVLMEPIGTEVFFLAETPLRLFGKRRLVGVDAAGSVYNRDSRLVDVYQGISDIAPPDAERLRHSMGEISPEIATLYLQLPGVDPRIPELARSVTTAAVTAYDKAAALETYLKQEYAYSLDLPRTPPADPLAYFLFERRAGHCEYFASAMAVMLRTLGIPSRIVNGFRTAEVNEVTGSYVIRGRDAHSWVEAYFPGYGWTSFDPTPPDPAFEVTALTRFLVYVDAMREFWREWVINYDFAHQVTLGQNVALSGRELFRSVRLWMKQKYRSLVAAARQAHRDAARSPQRWVLATLLGSGLLLLLVNLPRMWRWWRRRVLAEAPERAPRAAASIWYERMTQVLARRGWRKSPSQTPEEFLSSIGDPRLRPSVERFTRSYEGARFGTSVEDARALPGLFREIDIPSG